MELKLLDMNIAELTELMKQLGEQEFRAAQVFGWLHKGAALDEMTNIPKTLRTKLSGLKQGGVKIHAKYESNIDDTVKYLFLLEDDNLIEGVLMKYRHGHTLCLSTQVGCAMGCAFCASTLEGLVRNLGAGEILSQVIRVERDMPKAEGRERNITNLVLMGSGEPLNNYDNVVRFLKLVSAPEGLNISPRNISLSTCGLVPQLKRFMQEAPHVTLCISLHSVDDGVRSRLMPINRKYPVDEVIKAADEYAKFTGRRVIFEYALIKGINDSEADARQLAHKLKRINCHVNLIPLNDVPEREFAGVSRNEATRFEQKLTALGISATVRRELGTDIAGACGQLRRRVLRKAD